MRGYIRTFNYAINDKNSKIDEKFLVKLLEENSISNSVDNITFNSKTRILSITKNPYSFINSENKKIIYSYEEKQNYMNLITRFKKS